MNQIQMTETKANPSQSVKILSHEDQRKLIQGSYQHPGGIFVRLALFTGLRSEELLSLSWTDVDVYGSRICIRPAKNDMGVKPNYPRYVPLMPYVLHDLLEWQEVQRHSFVPPIPFSPYKIPVCTTLEGKPMTQEMLYEYFRNILRRSYVADYPFCSLRETFAIRCLEQGMSPKTLGAIMGDPEAASTYAQFIVSPYDANRAAMETLYSIYTPNAEVLAYPVIVTLLEDQRIMLYAPDFPETVRYCDNLAEGLLRMRERMEEDLHNSYFPPAPVSVARLCRKPNEFIILMCLNPR